MNKRALSCLLALSLWTMAPMPAMAAVPVGVQYEPTRQALVLQLPAGVVPTTLELSNPPRFVVDLPGTYPLRAESFSYPQGLVTSVVVARRGDTTRVVLTLRRPLNGAWNAVLDSNGRLAFVLPGGSAPVPSDTPRPITTPRPTATTTPRPTAKPTIKPTPKPTAKPTPKPTIKPTPKPTAKPTPLPSARPTVLPSPRPIPPIAPSPVPTLPPPAATPSPVQVLPSPLPTPPSDTPMALPTPSGEMPMILPTPAGEAPRLLPSIAPSAAPTARPTPAPTARPTARPSATPAPVRPTQATPAVKVGRVGYDEDTRFLTIALSGRVTPKFTMLEGPSRLVIELPSATLAAPQTMSFPGALVTELAAVQADATTTRITLTLARPVGQNWAQRQTPNALILIFDRLPVQP